MASVTDYGATNDPLSGPGLPAWAKAIADALNNSDIPVDTRIATGDAAKVSKSGDTMTGNLTFPEWIGPEGPTLRIAEIANGVMRVMDKVSGDPAPLAVADPTNTDHAATKGYVDGLLVGGDPAGAMTKPGIYVGYSSGTGTRVQASIPAGYFTQTPVFLYSLIAWVDPSDFRVLGCYGQSATGCTFYLRNKSGAEVAFTSTGVGWVAIGQRA